MEPVLFVFHLLKWNISPKLKRLSELALFTMEMQKVGGVVISVQKHKDMPRLMVQVFSLCPLAGQ